jgi:hypothetical protein
VRVAIGDITCNACHHMVYAGRPSMKVYRGIQRKKDQQTGSPCSNVKVCKIILLDTAALTSVSVMFLDHRNATTGGSGNNWPAFHFFQLYCDPQT